jgi:hypothetical protein
VTYNHPIYSATAGDWRLAGELEIGEEVLTYTGAATLCRKAPLPGAHTVYNLEIKDWHNFLVGELGVVVHNSCISKVAALSKYKQWRRTHPPGTQDQQYILHLKQMLQDGDLFEFYQRPIVTTTHNGKTYLIDGHHRWQAAKEISFPNLNHTDVSPTPEALSSLTRYRNIQEVINDSF